MHGQSTARQDAVAATSTNMARCAAGEKMFDLLTPAKMHNHLVPFTCLWTLTMFVLLFYMIGEFPMFFQLFNTLVSRQTRTHRQVQHQEGSDALCKERLTYVVSLEKL